MKNVISIEYFKTPFGELIIGSAMDKLCLCDWRYRKMRSAIDKRIKDGLDAEYIEESSMIITETKTQLTQYFNKERTEFDIPLLLIGTDFQKNVWNAEGTIIGPYSENSLYIFIYMIMRRN